MHPLLQTGSIKQIPSSHQTPSFLLAFLPSHWVTSLINSPTSSPLSVNHDDPATPKCTLEIKSTSKFWRSNMSSREISFNVQIIWVVFRYWKGVIF